MHFLLDVMRAAPHAMDLLKTTACLARRVMRYHIHIAAYRTSHVPLVSSENCLLVIVRLVMIPAVHAVVGVS